MWWSRGALIAIDGCGNSISDRLLARGFHNSELSFEFCDAVVNDIHGVITSANEIRPTLFWDVYLAFDEGEYYHNDKRDEDPSEAYTRPMIARILDDRPLSQNG